MSRITWDQKKFKGQSEIYAQNSGHFCTLSLIRKVYLVVCTYFFHI